MGEDPAVEIGRVLRQVRRASGLTLKAAADRTGGRLKATSIAGYERGERRISLERFLLLARTYGVEPRRLVAEIERLIVGRPPVAIDVSAAEGLGTTEGMLVADFAVEVRQLRHAPPERTVIIRSGDLEVLAAASGRRTEELTERIAAALVENRN